MQRVGNSYSHRWTHINKEGKGTGTSHGLSAIFHVKLPDWDGRNYFVLGTASWAASKFHPIIDVVLATSAIKADWHAPLHITPPTLSPIFVHSF
jgi:hypothetical protein